MGITIFHFAAGRIETGWSSFDELGMLRQLGMLPALVQTSA
jgi:predicted ester cyclase